MGEWLPGSVPGVARVYRTGEGPAVVVLHSWWGVDGHLRDTCDRLAAAGYRAESPDLLGGAEPGTEEEAQAAAAELNPEAAVASAAAHVDTLGSDRVGLVGYSLGGSVALAVATESPAVRVVVTYAGLWDSLPYERATASIHAHIGKLDPHVPGRLRRRFRGAVEAAGLPLALHEYRRQPHGFYDHTRDEYDEHAAALAWERTLEALGALHGA